ncbi:replication protein [Lacticaseibacillus paracasei]|nr:replication protein [Lacticaseibacillus paracasei]
MDWITTQFILIFYLEKNGHVLTRVVVTVYQKSSGNVTQF